MKLFYKLIIGFLLVALMSWITGYFAVDYSREALEKAFIERTEALAVQLLDGVERGVRSKIEVFQEYANDLTLLEAVKASNRKFKDLDNAGAYIDRRDKEWRSVPKEAITPFMQNLINNKLSAELRRKAGFYRDHYGHNVFSEIFVTNKYGANVAQTGKTSDYRQDDEEWWQTAKKKGVYIRDVNFDESADVYSVDFALKIDDSEGNFIGALKVVINIDDILQYIHHVEDEWIGQKNRKVNFKIINENRQLIYSTEDFKFLEDHSDFIPASHLNNNKAGHVAYSANETRLGTAGEEIFVSHVHSSGEEWLKWILMVEQRSDELFAPVARFKRRIFTGVLLITLIGVLIGSIVSGSIAGKVNKLKSAAVKIGSGELETRIDVDSNDEIGQLAKVFKQMAENLRENTVARKELIEEVSRRKKSEDKYRSLVTNIPDVVWTTDIHGETSFISDNVKQVYGYTSDEVYSGGEAIWTGRIHPDDITKVEEEFKALFEEGKPLDVEYRIQRKDGQWIWLQDKSIGTYEKEGVHYADGVFIDITAHKQAEEKLIKSDKELRKKVKELEKFYEMAIGRETKMKTLKKKILALQSELAANKNEEV